jgi:hypothetical protein
MLNGLPMIVFAFWHGQNEVLVYGAGFHPAWSIKVAIMKASVKENLSPCSCCTYARYLRANRAKSSQPPYGR